MRLDMTSDWTRKMCENCCEIPHYVCEHHQIIEEFEMLNKYLFELLELLGERL